MMWIWLTACSWDTEKVSMERDAFDNGLMTLQNAFRSSADGLISLEIPVQDADSNFLLTVIAQEGLTSLEAVYDPDGNIVLDAYDWFNADQGLTDAVYAESNDMVLNWPPRMGDMPLREGNWVVEFSTLDNQGYYSSDIEGTAFTQIKQDSDFTQGTLVLSIGISPESYAEPDVVQAVNDAVDCWTEMWEPMGLSLDVSISEMNISNELPWPSESPAIESLSASGSERDLLMLVGESIENEEGTFGIAGSVPGTLLSTQRAAVVISWLENAGVDGIFQEEDVQLMCETMAHELGHYLGLYHPVEMDYDAWDALDDTVMCTDEFVCESELGDNLMYPYPVCSLNDCVNQVNLSENQLGVIHNYTGAL